MKSLQYILLLSLALIVFSCKNQDSKKFHLTGEIKNLTKGTVYLAKIRDENLILVDSFQVRNNGKFDFTDYLSSPEMYYILLKEYPGDKAMIFAEPGEIIFNTHVERFVNSSEVLGSENHKLWNDFKKIIQKFNDQRLELIQQKLLAEKNKDTVKIDSVTQKFNQLIRRRYLYATNFAVTHADKEVSPYVALTELYDANEFLLDTIYQSMTDEVKKSYYGKVFRRYYTKSDKNLKK